MGIKSLLIVVDSSEASDSRVELAASLAAEHAAHLVGLYVLPLLEPDPSRPDPLIDKIVTAYIREDQELARATRLRFDADRLQGAKRVEDNCDVVTRDMLCDMTVPVFMSH